MAAIPRCLCSVMNPLKIEGSHTQQRQEVQQYFMALPFCSQAFNCIFPGSCCVLCHMSRPDICWPGDISQCPCLVEQSTTHLLIGFQCNMSVETQTNRQTDRQIDSCNIIQRPCRRLVMTAVDLIPGSTGGWLLPALALNNTYPIECPRQQVTVVLISAWLCEEFVKGLGLLDILTIELLPCGLLNTQPEGDEQNMQEAVSDTRHERQQPTRQLDTAAEASRRQCYTSTGLAAVTSDIVLKRAQHGMQVLMRGKVGHLADCAGGCHSM